MAAAPGNDVGPASGPGLHPLRRRLPVPVKATLRGALTECVATHLLRDVVGNVLAAVVHSDGVAHHLRCNGGPPRPRLDHAPLPGAVELLNLLTQVLIHERAFLRRSSHTLPRFAVSRSSGRAVARSRSIA